MSNISISSAGIASGETRALASANVRVLCAVAFLIGAGLVFMVGFANAAVLHNAAHDSRHSLAFPCH